MRGILHFLYKRAEDVLVLLTAVMFVAFIIQIASRYLFNAPTEWTHELILTAWIWAVFWGAAFLLRDQDHVKFDVLYNMGGEKTRRLLSLIAAVALAVGFLVSVPATWDFISFKAIRNSDVIGIRMDFVFGVYLLFLAGTIIHYGLRAFRLLRGDSLATLEKEETL
jgi:TRAP-type C4-dicarboxylate transport system permease small subunit